MTAQAADVPRTDLMNPAPHPAPQQSNGAPVADKEHNFAEFRKEYEAWHDAIDFGAATIVQPLVAEGTGLDGLPKELERRCCLNKSCGNTELKLVAKAHIVGSEAVIFYEYVRESNDDTYFGSYSDPAELVADINNPDYWPVDEDAYDTLIQKSHSRDDEYYARADAERERLGTVEKAPGTGTSKSAKSRRAKARRRAAAEAAEAADRG
jgi:hypothetical protein